MLCSKRKDEKIKEAKKRKLVRLKKKACPT